jgi:glycosyltransferase involved in cell wall biosynthesis
MTTSEAVPRVLVISQRPPPFHGSTVMTATFLDLLAQEKYEHILVDRRFSKTVDEVGSFKLSKIAAGAGLWLRLLGSLIFRRPSVCVFFVTNRPFSLLVDWTLAELLKVMRVRTVMYVHTSGFADLAARSRTWRTLVSRTLHAANDCVCLGPSLTADVSEWFDEKRIHVIPNGSPSPAMPAPRRDEENLTVLYFSNLLRDKGIVTFIDMAADLHNTVPGTHFVIAGADGEPDTMRDVQSSLDRHRDVPFELRGRVEGDEKWQVLRDADVLVFPSTYRYEAQPLSIIEAMSTSTAVIAFDTGGISDVVRPEAGRLAPVNDSAALARLVRDVLIDRQLLQTFQDGARATYEANHSLEAFSARWLPLLRMPSQQRPQEVA